MDPNTHFPFQINIESPPVPYSNSSDRNGLFTPLLVG